MSKTATQSTQELAMPDGTLVNGTDSAPALPTAAAVDGIVAAVTHRLETLRRPTSTYRVQLNALCTFRQVEAAVPYLYTLGITDLYASPFLQAQPGSVHGYDVVDHGAINVEIGTREELSSLRSALREHDMGLIADVVPNHMSASATHNRWWLDALENGPSSTFASYFDIDWMPLKPDLADKILLPVLGDQFGRALEGGQLVVRFGEGSFWLEYFEQRFPIAPRSYALILTPQLDELRNRLGDEHPDVQELLSILTAIKNLPPRNETNAERLAERRREKEVIKRRLHELVERSSSIAAYVAAQVELVNGRPGDARSFDRLDQLLQDQAYRLAFWRVAADEINYRRFFDINELAAICTESPQVFADTHRLLFELLDEGTISGLRIDHPDGLYDPTEYLCQLQERHFLRLCREAWRCRSPVPTAQVTLTEDEEWQRLERRLAELWRETARIPGSPLSRPLFLVVEKILARGESLPEDWPVHGTVGYEFLNALGGVLVDPAGERRLSSLYTRFTGRSLAFQELSYECKRLIVRMSMASELNVLGHRLDRISERNRRTRDFTLSSLTRALQEVAACFSVYRTYVRPDQLLERDARYVEQAVARAKRRNPAMSESIFNFVRDVLLLRHHDNADDDERRAIQGFTGKFQQLTGPITAKGIEDTAFYRFNRLVSLNEVGGDPARFGASTEEFHALNAARLPRFPNTLNTTSTHDTKRSEDVRARISVLSEVPAEWGQRVLRWTRRNRRHKTEIDGAEAPSRNAEYLLYQTLVGIWPDAIPRGEERAALVERLRQYMHKVVREAKVHTSWISPNQPYEDALGRFLDALLREMGHAPFLQEFDEFARRVADHGRWNSLSQLLLKIASPGVPDFYQGSELWNLTLVDPENRQPVDLVERLTVLDGLLTELAGAFDGAAESECVDRWISEVLDNARGQLGENPGTNSSMLAACAAPLLRRLLETRHNGLVKLFVTLLGLRARRRCGQLFTSCDYLPLETAGRFAEQIIAFARRDNARLAVVVAPRLTVQVVGFGGPPPLADVWEDTRVILPKALLPHTAGPLQDLFTSRKPFPAADVADPSIRLPVAEVLREFPVAMLFARSG